MFNKKWFYRRNKTEVIIDMDSGLGVERPIYPFRFETDNENYAELLTIRLNEKLEKAKEDIAKNAIDYIHGNPSALTALKKKLKNWNSKTNQWEFK